MATNPKPYGITLPIMRGNQGYFAQSYSINEQIKSNLNLLLRTKKGERRMNPEFGSGLWNVLFEQNTENIVSIVEDTIRKDISKWMQFVNISSVDVDNQTDPTRHVIGVTVKYTVPSIGITNEQVLQVNMNTVNV